MPKLNLTQSEFELESKFEPRLWGLLHNTPDLYETLLRNLKAVGLAAGDLRHEPGDGSIGAGGLTFWMLGFNSNARIKLESFSIRCSSLARTGRSQFLAALNGLMATVEQVSKAPFKFTGHTVAYSCHGTIEGSSTATFIGRFVSSPPKVAGLGPHVGSGTALYFDRSDSVLSSIVTLDPSKSIDGGLFVRIVIVTDGSQKTAEELSALCEKKILDVFASLDLSGVQIWS